MTTVQEFAINGYVKGATVRQYYHGTMYDDAVIEQVDYLGNLLVNMKGERYGWHVNYCTVVPGTVSPVAAQKSFWQRLCSWF